MSLTFLNQTIVSIQFSLLSGHRDFSIEIEIIEFSVEADIEDPFYSLSMSSSIYLEEVPPNILDTIFVFE